VRFYTEKRPFCVFERGGGGGLGAANDDHLRLIKEFVVDFLLVLIDLFSLGVTAEALRANIGSKSVILLPISVDRKFQGKRVIPTTILLRKLG